MLALDFFTQRTSKQGGMQNATRKAASLIALVIASATATASAATADPTVPSSPSQSVGALSYDDFDSEWEDVMLWYLIWLYQKLGGNPADLSGPTIPQSMGLVVSRHMTHGFPSAMTATEVSQLRTIIVKTQIHLTMAPTGYYPDDVAFMYAYLNLMLADAGGGSSGSGS